jgi:hypothetical protein
MTKYNHLGMSIPDIKFANALSVIGGGGMVDATVATFNLGGTNDAQRQFDTEYQNTSTNMKIIIVTGHVFIDVSTAEINGLVGLTKATTPVSITSYDDVIIQVDSIVDWSPSSTIEFDQNLQIVLIVPAGWYYKIIQSAGGPPAPPVEKLTWTEYEITS